MSNVVKVLRKVVKLLQKSSESTALSSRKVF
jgi:hypothetical protein